MDRVSATLVNLLNLVTSPRGDSTVLSFIPVEEIIVSLLRDVASDMECRQLANEVIAVGNGQQDIATAYESINTTLDRIEDAPAKRDQLYAQLDSFNTSVDQVITLSTVLNSNTLRYAEVLFDNLQIFRLIQKFYIAPNLEKPETIFVGMGPRSKDKDKTTIQFSKKPLLERIRIAYGNRSPYPLLTVTTASMSNNSELELARSNWLQKDSSEYDLRVLNARSKDLGKIFTEQLKLPFEIEGGKFKVIIPDMPGTTFLSTTIVDVNRNVLAKCIRVIPSPELASA